MLPSEKSLTSDTFFTLQSKQKQKKSRYKIHKWFTITPPHSSKHLCFVLINLLVPKKASITLNDSLIIRDLIFLRDFQMASFLQNIFARGKTFFVLRSSDKLSLIMLSKYCKDERKKHSQYSINLSRWSRTRQAEDKLHWMQSKSTICLFLQEMWCVICGVIADDLIDLASVMISEVNFILVV